MTVTKHCTSIRAILIIIGVALLASLACSDRRANDDTASVSHLSRAVYEPQGFIELPLAQLPNMKWDSIGANIYGEPLDEDSIELFEYRGGRYYHPVNLSHRCFVFIGAYHHTGESKYLQRAEKNARKLMTLLDDHGGAEYAPYCFNFAVHGDSSLLMEAPWYSGMAQGELMCVLVRLYELTGQQDYLDAAERMFKSFLGLREDFTPWTVRLDPEGYYWLEEYPHAETPGMTLNGYIAGLFGVYDYFRVTHDPQAGRIWDLSITTLKHYLPNYRCVNRTSLYCLGHSQPATISYHHFHIWLCDRLYSMTGDDFFRVMADLFRFDA